MNLNERAWIRSNSRHSSMMNVWAAHKWPVDCNTMKEGHYVLQLVITYTYLGNSGNK